MTDPTTQPAIVELDDEDLVVEVAELLTQTQGRPIRVHALTREPSPFATLFPAEILSASLEGGIQLRLFLKHLGPEEPGQPDKQRRDREIRVYEVLLRELGLPVPRYYGSRWNVATARHELYLEYVDDWPLRYHGLEHWVTAAHRLGELHAHFSARGDLLRSCDFLLRLDRAYFTTWAGRACAAVAGQCAELAYRLDETLESYGPAYELMADQPLTLVHNDLAPKNILADRSTTPARICLVDWELAGAGCGLLDLVHLKYGLEPADEREVLRAYRRAVGSTGFLPEDEREFDRLLAACELHKTLYRLAHSPGWKLPLSTITQWITDAAAFMERV
jgi:tRNA A-37 threonylcarbamoyl transferase component Bud32